MGVLSPVKNFGKNLFPFRYYFSIPQFTLSGQGQIFSNGRMKVATNYAPHTPLVVLQPWNFFKPMLLKTTITFIFIFSLKEKEIL
jgi:hypothetical protein